MDDTRRFLLAIVDDGAFLLCACFVAYVLLIIVPFLRRRPKPVGESRAFQWHFIVPCLDEGAVIDRTVRSLATDFPRAHIWCVDDGSTDDTGPLLARLAARCDRIHVVTRQWPDARQGKGPALNAGWRAIESRRPAHVDPANVIVGVVDADGRLDRRCLDTIAGPDYFGDPGVGAVQVQVRVVDDRAGSGRLSLSRLLVRLQDIEFAGTIAAIQTFRQQLGSVGMGGNGQFTRLSVLDRIADEHSTPWHGALLEDFELGVHVLLTGSRTAYCNDTFVEQEGLRSVRLLVRQRCRWAQGSMQCISYLRPVLRSPNIGNAGALEIGYFLLLPWLQLIGGAIYVVATVVLVWLALTIPGGVSTWVDAGGWGLLPLFVVFGLGPIIVWGPVYRMTAAREISRHRALALGIANWPYSYLHHVATWWAFVRVLRSRHDWKKTDRRAERLGPAPQPVPLLATAAAVPTVVPLASSHSVRPQLAELPPTDEDWEQLVAEFGPALRPRERIRTDRRDRRPLAAAGGRAPRATADGHAEGGRSNTTMSERSLGPTLSQLESA